jgi:hypothetical protein
MDDREWLTPRQRLIIIIIIIIINGIKEFYQNVKMPLIFN